MISAETILHLGRPGLRQQHRLCFRASSIIRLTVLILPGLFAFLLSSCGVYSFTGASISPEVKTISIINFPNNAPLVQPTLSLELTNALKDKFSSQTNLTLVQRDGDL
ncbi:MAG: hypothetical protein IH599_06160, partial [Bacteroidales bacterium]|nr:hypothetical protein [Bacteroidales bacterium]